MCVRKPLSPPVSFKFKLSESDTSTSILLVSDELIVISAIVISYAFGADVMLAAKPAVSVCV